MFCHVFNSNRNFIDVYSALHRSTNSPLGYDMLG